MSDEPTANDTDEKTEVGTQDAAEGEKPSVKSQIPALLLLLVAFGFLFAVTKFLPGMGDYLSSSMKKVMGSETADLPEMEEPPEPDLKPAVSVVPIATSSGSNEKPTPAVKPVAASESTVKTVPTPPPAEASPDSDEPIDENKIREQIVEQLGGGDACEVQHHAFSDDKAQMIAALKITGADGKIQLIEVLFDRDNFGRYISQEDSPLDGQIKIYP